MTEKAVALLFLAAGQCSRMQSALPKVLQPIAGRPMLAQVIAAARELQPAAVHVVFGHGGEMPATVPALRHMIQALEENFPNGDYLWGYTQAHREDWEMVKTALDMGASTVRIGFEDSDMIAPGVHVDNNAALIAKVSDIVKSKGMMPMTPDEVRAMLKIPPLRR